MKNIVKIKSYSAESANSGTDMYFNFEGLVNVVGSGSEIKIMTYPSLINEETILELSFGPGKNLVTPSIIEQIKDAIAENSLTPLAILDLDYILEPIMEEYPFMRLSKQTDLPNIINQ